MLGAKFSFYFFLFSTKDWNENHGRTENPTAKAPETPEQAKEPHSRCWAWETGQGISRDVNWQGTACSGAPTPPSGHSPGFQGPHLLLSNSFHVWTQGGHLASVSSSAKWVQ